MFFRSEICRSGPLPLPGSGRDCSHSYVARITSFCEAEVDAACDAVDVAGDAIEAVRDVIDRPRVAARLRARRGVERH